MTWTFSHDVDEYATAAGQLLQQDPERHTISLTVIEGGRHRQTRLDPPELFAWWTDAAGRVTGSGSITPPWPLLVEAMPDDAIAPLVEGLRARNDVTMVGVNGPNHIAASFAAAWRAATKEQVVLHDAIRLFRLGKLQSPAMAPEGRARRASEADVPLVVDWFERFVDEVDGVSERAEENVRQRMALGSIWLWCDAHGEPVSLAGNAVPAAGVARVGPVFTPKEQRGRGYAGAVTHKVSEEVQRQGLKAVLFTDQANPTSNALYMRLGYEAVSDRLALHFEPVAE